MKESICGMVVQDDPSKPLLQPEGGYETFFKNMNTLYMMLSSGVKKPVFKYFLEDKARGIIYPYYGYITRFMFEGYRSKAQSVKILVITGAQGTGKTSLQMNIAEDIYTPDVFDDKIVAFQHIVLDVNQLKEMILSANNLSVRIPYVFIDEAVISFASSSYFRDKKRYTQILDTFSMLRTVTNSLTISLAQDTEMLAKYIIRQNNIHKIYMCNKEADAYIPCPPEPHYIDYSRYSYFGFYDIVTIGKSRKDRARTITVRYALANGEEVVKRTYIFLSRRFMNEKIYNECYIPLRREYINILLTMKKEDELKNKNAQTA